VILYKDEAYVGGKRLDNSNGKITDFLVKNGLSDNVSFLEIKTHKTKLLDKTAYRGDDVYCAGKDLTGSIVQVLNQRDNFQKVYYINIGKNKDKTKIRARKPVVVKANKFETINSKCVVLVCSN